MQTYKFRSLIHNETGRDIPSSWFFVIADSKEEAQERALDYVKNLNEHNERLHESYKRDTFYSGAVFEHVVPYGYLNESAINFDQIKSFSVK